jgi:iron complex transport system substrate-binding protein
MAKVFNEVLGRNVDVPDEPRRIVSFSPAITESLFLLGMGDSVAGVSAFCSRPPEARSKRKVGSYNTVSLELLRQISPDLIFTVTGYQRNFALRLSEEFPVYPIELPVSISGIIDMVVKVGLVVGRYDNVRRLEASLAASLSSLKSPRSKVKGYVEIDLGGPVSFGAHSYITDALNILGVSTPFDGVREEWVKPDFGAVARFDPEIFIYEAKMYSSFPPDGLERLIGERGWSGLSFAKAGNYFLAPGPLDFLAHHGPSFVTEALPWLSQRVMAVASR